MYFYRYFKNVYFVVCLNGFLYFVFKFNELGCKNLIDVLFVESLIIRSFFNVIEKNEVFSSILNEIGWSD